MLSSTASPGMMWLQIVGSAAVAQRASFGVRASCVLASATRPAHRESGDAAARTSPVPEDHTTQRFRIHMPHSGADVQRCIGAAAVELRRVEGRARPTPHARRILMKQLQSITVHRARTHAHAAGRLRHCSALSASAHTNWICRKALKAMMGGMPQRGKNGLVATGRRPHAHHLQLLNVARVEQCRVVRRPQVQVGILRHTAVTTRPHCSSA